MRKIFKKIPVILGLFILTMGWLNPSLSYAAKTIEGVVNVNEASVDQLTLLPGIGQAKAQLIVETRKTTPFKSLEDLKKVKGIGEKRLELLKGHVSFSGPTTAKGSVVPKASAKAETTQQQTTPSN